MSTAAQEIVPKPEQEVLEADGSSVESSSETTKEIFRHEDSPHESPDVRSPKIQSPVVFPRSKTTTQSHSAAKTKNEAGKKKSNSGIPLRLKNNPVNNSKTNQTRVGGYRHQQPGQTIANVINKNTLEVQFINNKKRLLQLHADLIERQRPLLDMHKSLLRTKKQLEGLGKKVVLEDLKVMTLKGDDLKTPMEGAGESPAAETAMNLKSSIENVLDSCAKVCQKCLVKRDDVVKMLENVSKSEMNPDEVEAEIEELKRDKVELEKDVESTISENEKKIDELITNWQKTVKSKSISEEMTLKLGEMEETIKAQQKTIAEAEDNAHIAARKYEEKKANYEKMISEWQEKNNKLEEELKRERKNANDNLMKSRNLRSKVAELEMKYKEAEEKSIEAVTKLKQLQEQMRKKEVQWIKEKDDFKKNEALLQQKFTEKQSQFDTRSRYLRLRDMERIQKDTEMQQENFYKTFETQLEIKDQELALLEKEKEVLAEKTRAVEEQLEEMKRHLEEKDREIDELSLKAESIPAIEYKKSESPWLELIEYKQKITEVQTTLQEQTDQISKMQSSLKAHAQLAAALKLENDNVIKYSTKLRDILQEARDELEFKNKTIYKIHEKLVLKEQACKKLKAQLKEYEILHDYSRGEQWHKNRCQICMSSLGGEKQTTAASSSYDDTEVGKSNSQSPQSQYVSESLIGMSVKKVDNLRARLDNLKKLKLPDGSRQIKVNYSWSNQSCQNKPFTNHLGKQIKLRGKLYQILQKHADQSCEDFINLLKLSVSNSGKSTQNRSELKPSNMTDQIDDPPRRYSPRKIKITESFSAISQYFKSVPFSDIIDKLSESTEGEMC